MFPHGGLVFVVLAFLRAGHRDDTGLAESVRSAVREDLAWIIIDAAKRHGAASIAELGAAAGARVAHLGPARPAA